jgi:heterodisulfide reductase subunit B
VTALLPPRELRFKRISDANQQSLTASSLEESAHSADLFATNCHFCQSQPDVSRDRFTTGLFVR